MADPDFRLTAKQNEVNGVLGGTQTHTLIYGGGRSGKTFLIIRAILIRAMRAPKSTHFILRHRFNAVVRSIGGENGTLPTVLRLCFPEIEYDVDRTQWIYTLPNGSQIYLMGLDDKNRTEKILGLEASSVYFNEASQISYSAYTMALSRLVQKATIKDSSEHLKLRSYGDLNPSGTAHWTYRLFIENVYPSTSDQKIPNPQNYAWAAMNPADNRENLAPEALAELENLPEAERIRFFEGRFVDEVDNAIFKRDWIARNRVNETPDDLQWVTIAVDPSGSERGDECGIVCAARHNDDYYVFADHSGQMGPTDAARKAIQKFDLYQADDLAVETNYGGDWTVAMIRATARDMHSRGERDRSDISVKKVTVFRGKALRAGEVANLYELGRVHHVGTHPELESQMLSMTHDWSREANGSPDRVDALVMAITLLAQQASSGSSFGFGVATMRSG